MGGLRHKSRASNKLKQKRVVRFSAIEKQCVVREFNSLRPFYEGRHTKTYVVLEKIRTRLQASLKNILFWLIFRKPKPMILQLFELHERPSSRFSEKLQW
jgi:hypothetical protein